MRSPAKGTTKARHMEESRSALPDNLPLAGVPILPAPISGVSVAKQDSPDSRELGSVGPENMAMGRVCLQDLCCVTA